MTAQITVRADGSISSMGRKIGHISLNTKTGKRRLLHDGKVHDLTHLFHTDKLNAKLAEIFGL